MSAILKREVGIENLDEPSLWCPCRICARSLHKFITGGDRPFLVVHLQNC